jgi:hypothetical protein
VCSIVQRNVLIVGWLGSKQVTRLINFNSSVAFGLYL